MLAKKLSRFGVYKVFDSPDRQYQLVVLRSFVPIAGPGQMGDAPGWVQLRKGEILIREGHVDMVSQVETPVWSSHHVEVKLVLDWDF